MKKILFVFIIGIFLTAVCFAQAIAGEVNRGIFYQQGIASWYGREFNGRPTASGEIFNDSQLTAAHPILPFGTMLKVTNQHNNKTVTVRVNDRGPFVAARIIDLSRAAAQQLDMLTTGTAPVIIESLQEVIQTVVSTQNAPQQGTFTGDLSPNSGDASKVKPVSADKLYKVQVGAYKKPEYAVEMYEKLKKSGFNPMYEKYCEYHRVVIAGLRQEDLKIMALKLENAGFRELWFREQ